MPPIGGGRLDHAGPWWSRWGSIHGGMILARYLGFACAAALFLPAATAAAQTAGDINRLNQAVQICNSPMGAGMPECAKLRGRLGMRAPSVGGFGGGGLGLGGGKGAAAAGILGALNSAMSARQAPVAAAPTAPVVSSNAIAGCVRNAAGDAGMIQACLSAASMPRPAAPSLGYAQPGAPSLGQPLLPSAQRSYDAAAAIHQGGQNYHACVAANPGAWQSCVPLLNGGQPVR